MECLVQWAQVIGTLALILTLLTVIWYTVKTSEMAKATRAMADSENRNTELRERPIVKFVVGKKQECLWNDERTGLPTMRMKRPFRFTTIINNVGKVHAKVRVKATVLHLKKPLEFPKNDLYKGKRTLEMQAGTGVDGHLSFDNLFKANNIEVPTKKQSRDSPIKYMGHELLVRLESRVIYYYNQNSEFGNDLSKNPPAYYRWHGQFAIDAFGSWIPEYDLEDFRSIPEMT